MRPDDHVPVERVDVPGADEAEAWAIAGPPGLAVITAMLGGFGELPDAVVSGINAGANTGRAVLHSGTVGAVLTGQNFGVSGLAVSVSQSDPWRWDTAAAIAVRTLDLLAVAPPRSGLNLNVPACDPDEVRGVRWARLAPFGEVRAGVGRIDEGRLQFVLRATEVDFAPDTDQGLLKAGYATLTALVGIAEAWPAEEGLAEEAPDVGESLVPGAPLHEVHGVPDASAPGTLRRPVIDTTS